nr:hypothetical protein [Nitrososphaerota archaeon]
MEEDDYLAEACYYLSDLKLSLSDIARELDLTPERVENAIKNYKSRIDSGRVHYDEDARDFWSKNLKEGLGEEKITLVDEKGRYYHGW